MTPKEKADELYKMYNNILIEEIIDRRPTYLVMTHKMAKKAALIAVDEILQFENKIHWSYTHDELIEKTKTIKFWAEVKQQIEKTMKFEDVNNEIKVMPNGLRRVDINEIKHLMKPKHYENDQQYDVIDIIKDYDLNFNEGNAVKYIVRARRKGAHLDDLRKAMHYLDREIIHHEAKLKFKNK
jgi:hypothetical protein